MSLIIMSEKKQVEAILGEKGVLSTNVYSDIRLLSRYYRECGMEIKEEVVEAIIKILEEKVQNYNYHKWIDIVDKLVGQTFKEDLIPLSEVEEIPITKQEFNIVGSLDTKEEKYLLHTLIILARFRNLRRDANNNWVTYPTNLIFKIASLTTIAIANQDFLIKELKDRGYISYAKKGNSLSIKVECLSEDVDDIMYSVTALEKLGSVYSDNEKLQTGNYIRCCDCGKVFKKTITKKGRQSKYCTKCKKEAVLKSHSKYRNKQKAEKSESN